MGHHDCANSGTEPSSVTGKYTAISNIYTRERHMPNRSEISKTLNCLEDGLRAI